MNEFNVCAAALKSRLFASLFNHGDIAIDARYMPCGSNQPGGEQRNIAHSTAEVEHAHAGLGPADNRNGPVHFSRNLAWNIRRSCSCALFPKM